ncbi:MAG: SDR family NAD(P)-dependent oxidoreductase [Acidimicrobiia bacterium]|nr:SDR family NAD(P)-dependent oxidoreductase [Acidimicrobiia bacterium]
MKLSDQVVLITGATGQIGRALVTDLASDAQRVLAVDLAAGPAHGQPVPDNVAGYTCDLADHVAVERLAASLADNEPAVTVVVNCAGRIHSEPAVKLLSDGRGHHEPDSWRDTIAANLDTTFNVGVCFAEQMVRGRRPGVIVNISSVAAAGNAGQSAYSAAKAAVNALTVTWAKELGGHGIRCVAVAPGFMDTETTRTSLSEKHIDRWVKTTPLRRMGTIDDVTSAVRFAIENDFYSGRVIELDGGLRL